MKKLFVGVVVLFLASCLFAEKIEKTFYRDNYQTSAVMNGNCLGYKIITNSGQYVLLKIGNYYVVPLVKTGKKCSIIAADILAKYDLELNKNTGHGVYYFRKAVKEEVKNLNDLYLISFIKDKELKLNKFVICYDNTQGLALDFDTLGNYKLEE